MTNDELKLYVEEVRAKITSQRRHDAAKFSRIAIKDYLRLMKELHPQYSEALDFASDVFDRLSEDPVA